MTDPAANRKIYLALVISHYFYTITAILAQFYHAKTACENHVVSQCSI